MTRWVAVLLVGLAACGNITRKSDDAGVVHDDAPVDDAGIDAPADASIDAPPPSESREIMSGGGTLTGAMYTFEVEVGHAFQQSQASGPTYTIEGNAAVKP